MRQPLQCPFNLASSQPELRTRRCNASTCQLRFEDRTLNKTLDQHVEASANARDSLERPLIEFGEKGPHKQLVGQPLKVVDHDDRNIDVDLRVPKVAKREKER